MDTEAVPVVDITMGRLKDTRRSSSQKAPRGTVSLVVLTTINSAASLDGIIGSHGVTSG